MAHAGIQLPCDTRAPGIRLPGDTQGTGIRLPCDTRAAGIQVQCDTWATGIWLLCDTRVAGIRLRGDTVSLSLPIAGALARQASKMTDLAYTFCLLPSTMLGKPKWQIQVLSLYFISQETEAGRKSETVQRLELGG